MCGSFDCQEGMHGDSYDSAPVLHEDMSEYVAAAMKGDEISRHALLALKMVMLDYPEPESVEEALDTPEAEYWAQTMKQEFGSM